MNLKAANVLLTKTYNIAKIGDVDQAQVMSSNTRQQHPAPFAISAYLAPELVLGGKCTEKVHITLYDSALLCMTLQYSVVGPAYGHPRVSPTSLDQQTLHVLCLAETETLAANW